MQFQSQIVTEQHLYDVFKANPDQGLIIDDCLVGALYINSVDFNKPVIITNSIIQSLEANGAYFTKGFQMSGCIVNRIVSFEAGGYNDPGIEFRIENNIFNFFVDFFDCVFKGPVIVKNNIFNGGSNLMGNKGKVIQAKFNGGLQCENNFGEIGRDGCL